MKKLFLLALLSLTSTQTFASITCTLGEIRAFTKTPDLETWMPTDGRSLPIRDNEKLFVVIGNIYGGDGQTNFSIPKIDNMIVDQKNYPYYMCANGNYPGSEPETYSSFISQFPDSTTYNVFDYDKKLVNMDHTTKLDVNRYTAYAAVQSQELWQGNNVVVVPTIVTKEVVKAGPAHLRNYMAVSGWFVSAEEMPQCEIGGLYLTLMNRSVDYYANYKEISSSQPLAQVTIDGQASGVPMRVMECLK